MIAIAPGIAELSLAPIVSTPGIGAAIESSTAVLIRVVTELAEPTESIGGAQASELLDGLMSKRGPIVRRSDASTVLSAAGPAHR